MHCSALGNLLARRSAVLKSLKSMYKLLDFFIFRCGVTSITRGAVFGRASASLDGTKEAATTSYMTFTLESPRHFPNVRSGWRNGILHRLS